MVKKFNLHFHKPAGRGCAHPPALVKTIGRNGLSLEKSGWEEPEKHSCKLTLLRMTAEGGKKWVHAVHSHPDFIFGVQICFLFLLR